MLYLTLKNVDMLKNNKTCIIYNYAQHYRAGIFKLLDKELECDFFFGNKMGDVKKMDLNMLNNPVKELNNIKILSNIYWQKEALNLIFKKKYDKYIILGEYYCVSTWMILILSYFSNKKVYLWTHGWYGNENTIKKLIKKLFFNLSDGILLYGNYAKNLMINEGFDQSKLHVIYNSLDYELQINIRDSLSTSTIFQDYFKNNNKTLIFIGRLTKVKNLELLLEVQANLLKKNMHYNIVIVGDGDERERLECLMNKMKLSNVWFYGPTYDEKEIGNLIFNSHLCVSPGNVGLTSLHSMVYGTPVCTNNLFTEQMPEFEAIDFPRTGFFFEKNNIESLSSSISDWSLNVNSRDLIRNFCYEKIDKFYNPKFQLSVIKKVLNEN